MNYVAILCGSIPKPFILKYSDEWFNGHLKQNFLLDIDSSWIRETRRLIKVWPNFFPSYVTAIHFDEFNNKLVRIRKITQIITL